MEAAQAHFAELEMHKTAERNGVLIFVAAPGAGNSCGHRRLRGVHARCGKEFWEKVAAEMTGHFKREEFTAGIMHGIHKAGELLCPTFSPASRTIKTSFLTTSRTTESSNVLTGLARFPFCCSCKRIGLFP